MPGEIDCVVVGAGLAGSVAALCLAESGLEVMVVEQRAPLPSPRLDQRALVLSPASVRILGDAGLWPRLAPRSTALTAIRISERGAFGTVALEAAEVGLGALGWACPADHLLSELNAALLENKRVRVQWSTRFTTCEPQPGAIRIRLQGLNGERVESARLLVGADGARSSVREATAVGIECFDYGQQAIVAMVGAARPCPGTAFELFSGEGPLALIPQGADRYVTVQCLSSARAQLAAELDDAAYLDMLERRSGGRLGALSALGPRRVYDLVRQRAERLIGVRSVLVGNAANTVHPNAAQGLNLGLRDAAALARVIGGSADAGARPGLRRYAALRRRDHRSISGFTHVLAQTFTSSLLPVACARRSLLLACAHSLPLRRRLVAELSGIAALTELTRQQPS